MTERIEVFAVTGMPEVAAGDDVAQLIADSGIELLDGDVLVVTSKVVSKAEGRLLPGGRDDHLAAETVRVVAQRGDLCIVETRHGFVMAAAGIDASNVPAGHVALLPQDPDESARRIRAGLRANPGVDVAVVVSDTMGRPWRDGVVDTAIGAAGLDVLHDLRGETDPAGHLLEATVVAIGDELAAAADLVKAKLAGTPVAVIRGFPLQRNDPDHGAGPLVRQADDDMFRLGTREAMAHVVKTSALAESVSGSVDADAVRRAVAAVEDPAVALEVAADRVAARGDPLRVGLVLGRLLAALAAEGLRGAWWSDDPPTLRIGRPG